MNAKKMTAAQLAARFGCSEARVKEMLARAAADCLASAEKARQKGGTYRGITTNKYIENAEVLSAKSR